MSRPLLELRGGHVGSASDEGPSSCARADNLLMMLRRASPSALLSKLRYLLQARVSLLVPHVPV